MGKLSAAVEAFDAAVDVQPSLANVYFNKGVTLREMAGQVVESSSNETKETETEEI